MRLLGWKKNINMINIQKKSNLSANHAVVNQKLTSSKTSWWFQPTPLKNDGVSNSWDDFSIPLTVSGKS